MRKRTLWLGALGIAAVLVAGGLLASNMGFKLNYALDGPGTNNSSSGTSSLALPFHQQTDLADAEDLIADINAGAGSSVVVSISRWDQSLDGLQTYTGTAGVNFGLVPGDGYYVVVNTDTNYIVVGSHDPTMSVVFDGPGSNSSVSGTNYYSLPYHTTATDAEDLIAEVNIAAGTSAVVSVSQWDKTLDGLTTYTGTAGVNFTLAPGQGYFVVVNTTVTAVPSHY